MAITNRWWERATLFPASTNALPVTTTNVGNVTPTLNASATLLRSRYYPQFTMIETNVGAHSDTDWMNFIVEFVAWYDEGGTGIIPQPDDLDDRIVATARLSPRRYPSVSTPTNGFYVVWDNGGDAVQSFGKRKPNPATFTTPQLNVGMWVLDPSFFYYTGHTNVGFAMTCYIEGLFGV